MIRTSTFEAARATRSDPRPLPESRGAAANSNFIGRQGENAPPGHTDPMPQVFLVEQSPDSQLKAHFHRRNQFQLVVAGSGSIGRHPIAPLTVHYAGRDSGYGPIDSGPEGLWYLTIREIATAGAWFLPEKKGDIDRDVPKVQMTSTPRPAAAAGALAALGAPHTVPLIEPHPTGLAAHLHQLPANATWRAGDPKEGSGAFFVVTAGDAIFDGNTYPRLSVFYASRDETGFSLGAGPAGAEFVEMRFPG